MAKAEVSITVLLEKAQEKRLMDVVAATESEVARSGVVRLVLDHFFASLRLAFHVARIRPRERQVSQTKKKARRQGVRLQDG